MTALYTYSYIVVDTQRGCHTLKNKGVSCAAYNKGVNRNVRRWPQSSWLLQQRRRPEIYTQGWKSSTQAPAMCV